MAGWSAAELATLTGFSVRTIRYYVQRGMLVGPAFRGAATRYERSHLVRLLAIARLKAEGVDTLRDTKRRIDAMTEVDLVAFIAARPLSEPAARALQLPVPESARPRDATGGEPTTTAAPAASEATSTTEASPPVRSAEASLPGQPWQRIVVLPGLELLVATNASPLICRLVRQFCEHCIRQ